MSRQHSFHLLQDVHPSPLRLRQRLAHDLGCDAGHLDIHLQGGNSLARSGDFEIHVAVMIFGPGNVAQDRVLVAFLHQSHGHACHRSRQGHACIHQRQRRPADRCHR